MKIAYFTDTFAPQINGVANTLSRLAGYLEERGVEHLFFAPDYGTQMQTEANVVRFRGFRPVIYPDCLLAFPAYSEVKEQIERFEPDVVHVVTELGIGYTGLKAARELSIPLVMSYHTNFDRYLKFYRLPHLAKPLMAYMKWFHSYARLNLCPSSDTLRYLAENGFERLGIWSRGIDTARFSPAKRNEALRERLGGKDRLVFLYTGRISAEKGLDVLIESIRRVNEKKPGRALFVMTGDGPYLRQLQAQHIPNLIFTGFLTGEPLSEIYASSDVFLFPSGTETFGNVVLEAMASGLPVICADEGGITDFTAHRQNAYVCQTGSADHFADAISMLIDDPSWRKKLSAASLETARRRDWDSILNGLMEQYEIAASPVGQSLEMRVTR